MSSIHPFELVPNNVAPVTTTDQFKNKILLGKKRRHPKKKSNSAPLSSSKSNKRYHSIDKALQSTSIFEPSLYEKLRISSLNPFKKYWDIQMEVILLYNILTTSYFLAYQLPSGRELIFDVICWVLFVLDLLVCLLEERRTKKGEIISKFKKSFRKYLKKWFFVDLLSLMPCAFAGYPEVEYYFRMLRLLKLPSVIDLADGTGLGLILTTLRLGTVNDLGQVRYSFKFKVITSLIKLMIFIIFMIYFLGCFWYWFQKKVDNYKYSHGENNFEDMNYLEYKLVSELSYQKIALSSSYFMLTTIATIGYGDFLPKNIYEMSFMMFAMLFGVTLFGYISGSINSSVTFFSDVTHGQDMIGELYGWLDFIEHSQGKLPKRLRKKIVSHFEYYNRKDRLKSLAKCYWNVESSDDYLSIDQEYVKGISEKTYYKIIKNLYRDFWENFRYYFQEKSLFYAVVPHLQPRRFYDGESVFYRNMKIEEVHFILKGRIAIGVLEGENSKIFNYVGKYDVIGDFVLLTGSNNSFDYISLDQTETLMLPGVVFQ
jgi:hypothetical protein